MHQGRRPDRHPLWPERWRVVSKLHHPGAGLSEGLWLYARPELRRRLGGWRNCWWWLGGRWLCGGWLCGRWLCGRWLCGRWLGGRWLGGWWLRGWWLCGRWLRGGWLRGGWLRGGWLRGRWLRGWWLRGWWLRGWWLRGWWLRGWWLRGWWLGELREPLLWLGEHLRLCGRSHLPGRSFWLQRLRSAPGMPDHAELQRQLLSVDVHQPVRAQRDAVRVLRSSRPLPDAVERLHRLGAADDLLAWSGLQRRLVRLVHHVQQPVHPRSDALHLRRSAADLRDPGIRLHRLVTPGGLQRGPDLCVAAHHLFRSAMHGGSTALHDRRSSRRRDV